MEQVIAYPSAVENPHNTLNEAVKDTKRRGLDQGKSWMGQAEDSLLQAGKTESQIRILVRQNSKPQDLIVYAYGSVTKDLSGWGYTIKQGVIIITKNNTYSSQLFILYFILYILFFAKRAWASSFNLHKTRRRNRRTANFLYYNITKRRKKPFP